MQRINGTFKIKTSINEFYESIPKVYQIVNGEIITINAEYKLTAAGNKSTNETLITFELGV